MAVMLLVAVAFAMSTSACDDLRKTPTPTPIPSVDLPIDVLSARDAALSYLRSAYPQTAPATGSAWVAHSTNPTGQVGASSYDLTSGVWAMHIGVPTIAPGQVLYEIELQNSDTGFAWMGKLDGRYEILESNLNVSVDALIVRDQVLATVAERYADKAPPEGLVWVGERTTPQGAAGHESCRFGTSDWVMLVEYDVLPPDQMIYQVELHNSGSGFVWRGRVDAQGVVMEEHLPG